MAGREHVEDRRRRNCAENQQPADPEREREHAGVPQREHPLIIITAILMPSLRVLSNGVAWQPWGGAAFARARDEQKPVLLSIAATWCSSCHEMDRTSYADPDIVALINERFVPVRVDADDRPDISERYGLGGWPTTAFLTPGGEILAGGTFVPPDRMRGRARPGCRRLQLAAGSNRPQVDERTASPQP